MLDHFRAPRYDVNRFGAAGRGTVGWKGSSMTAHSSRNNGEKTGKRKPPLEHQFKPGNPGRPKGSRNKLGEAFIEDLHAAWEKHGMAAIEATIKNHPAHSSR